MAVVRPSRYPWTSEQRVYLQGLGQDDVLPYDLSLPYDPRGSEINRGCPEGYFAQLVEPGTIGATPVPGKPYALRCRLMATTTAQTIADESGASAAESWYTFTNTGFGAGFGDFLSTLRNSAGLVLLGVGALIFWGMKK